jgi:hypothetical protein
MNFTNVLQPFSVARTAATGHLVHPWAVCSQAQDSSHTRAPPDSMALAVNLVDIPQSSHPYLERPWAVYP